ncbi:MAG: DEAD/DEAH box helicase [Micrococcales bacterium]|nr:DEAD/DEAH box helicase [Micrococcales bacterium]NBS85800.1 DEAD/DEAH box helicase [Micrococcales bacterium]NBX94724.1 DEAD/DEAH box helicase [Actinomycetota bacterium]
MDFSDLGIDADIVAALATRGITNPFPIQEQAIPLALTGQDLIGQAKTGTGKTLGFGLPIIQRLGQNPEHGAKALVVVPTRELAIQVAEDLTLAASNRGTQVVAIYGGKSYEGQVAQIDAGAQLIVGTPGRLIDLSKQKKLDLSKIECMVLDEADEMLDLGFLPDVERLFAFTPAGRQTMLFSATMPGQIVSLARKYQNKPVHIRVNDPDEGHTKADIKQFFYRAHSLDKDEVVARILQAEGRGKTVIFTKTKRQAAKVSEELVDRGFKATALHGDMSQEARERSMDAFRAGKKDILVATEVAARGIDVDDVTHVINYTVPEDEKAYLHRTGRTGRAGRTGIAVTFVDWEDLLRWSNIDKALELGVPEPVETYSSSPHLFTDLDIPAGTKGRIAATKRPAGWKPGDDDKPKGSPRPKSKPKPNTQKPASAKPAENKKPRNRTRTYKQGE